MPGRHPPSLVRQGVQEVHWAELGCRICARSRHWVASATITITFLASFTLASFALSALAFTFFAAITFFTTLGFFTVTRLIRRIGLPGDVTDEIRIDDRFDAVKWKEPACIQFQGDFPALSNHGQHMAADPHSLGCQPTNELADH